MFILLELTLFPAFTHRNRHYLLSETALGNGTGGLVMTLHGELVDRFTRQSTTPGNVLGGYPHVAAAKRIAENSQRQVGDAGMPHAQPATCLGRQQVGTTTHRFGTTCQGETTITQRD